MRESLENGDVESEVIHGDWIRYDVQDSVELFFHIKNNKLFRMTTLGNYRDKLFEKIEVGTTEKELLDAEPLFVWDEFEEVWKSEKGIFIETDAETNTVRWISVYIKE